MNHLRFKAGDHAVIYDTNSELDNEIVIIIGISMYHVSSNDAFYIIEKISGNLFSTDLGDWKALSLTQHCLKPCQ
jgi:hypothetical protein